MRLGMSAKVSLPDKRTASGWDGGQGEGGKNRRGPWATSLVRPGLLRTSGLTARAEESGVSLVHHGAGGRAGGRGGHLRVRRGAWSFGSRFGRGGVFAGFYGADRRV